MLSLATRETHELPRPRDTVREAIDRLEAALPRREDSQVLIDFLEDDLREGLAAVAEVEAHFTDVLDTLRGGPLTPIALLEASDDLRVLQQIELLHTAVSHLRRRMSQAAGRLKAKPLRCAPAFTSLAQTDPPKGRRPHCARGDRGGLPCQLNRSPLHALLALRLHPLVPGLTEGGEGGAHRAQVDGAERREREPARVVRDPHVDLALHGGVVQPGGGP